jgi:2-keto-4-pentenoate hydratase/2-oxohepta-3-ene-1,7-dioic acid hydratase in catechol pathway
MKLALYDDYIPAVVNGDQIVDISAVVGQSIMNEKPAERMIEIISQFDALRPKIGEAAKGRGKPLASVKLRAPVPQPSKMLFGIGNYYENVESPVRPLDLFLKSPSSVLDPDGTVVLPPHDAVIFHHEAEIGFVIGKRAKDVPQARAMDYLFGYVCVIDVSARGVGRGVGFIDKSPETFGPFGPWIVTKDEIPDPQKLSVKLWVDGQLRQDYNTDDMEHPITEILSWASTVATLEVGDVFACGTNHQGLGPLQDGETCTIEVERVGRLTVKISDPLKRKWPVGVDRGIGQAVRKMRTTGQFPTPEEAFQTKRIA